MIDLEEIRAAVVQTGWYHGAVGNLDRDGLREIAAAFGEPFETEESKGHVVSTYYRVPSNPDERIALEFHNEAVYLSDEPTFVFFYCSGDEEFAGGGTGLITSETVLEHLTSAERRAAEGLEGVIHLARNQEKAYRLIRQHPVTGAPSVYYAARFPRALYKIPVPRILVVKSQPWLALLDRIDQVCAAHHEFVAWSSGTLLALDNFRTLHARYGVTHGRLVLWRVLCR